VSEDPRFDGVDAEDVWMRGEVLKLNKPDLTHIPFVPGLESRFNIRYEYNNNDYDNLKITLIKSPKGMKLEYGHAVWTPKTSDNGKSYNIELEITNGNVSSRINFKINVVTLGKALPTVIKDNSLIVQSTKTCDFNGNEGRFAITLPEEYKNYLNDIKIRPIEIHQMPVPYKAKPLSCLFKIETFNDMHRLQKNNKELHIKVELPIYNHQGLFNILFDTKLYVYHSGYFIKHLGAEWFWDTLYRVEKTNLLGIRYDTDFVNLEKTMYSENILDGVYLIGRGESAVEIVPLSEKKTLKKQSSKKAYSKVKKLCTPKFLEINSTFPYVHINNYNKITCETTLNGNSYIVHVKDFGEGKKWGSTNNPQVTVDEMFGWLLDATKKFDDFGLKYKTEFDLNIKNFVKKPNSITIGSFDTVRLNLNNDNSISVKSMKNTAVHEYYHHAQYETLLANKSNGDFYNSSKGDWIWEGTAQWFEDEVYEKDNNYFNRSPGGKILSVGVNADHNFSIRPRNAYHRFSYYKLLNQKCSKFGAKSTHQYLFREGSIITKPSDIRRITQLMGKNCTFDQELQKVLNDDTLASSFVYYNWATLLKNDISKLEGDESGFKFEQLEEENVFDDPNWSKHVLNTYHKEPHVYSKEIDIDDDVYDASIPAYGAKSFKVLASTLPKKDPLNSIDELKFSFVMIDGENKNFYAVATRGEDAPNDKNSFVMKSDKSHDFEDDERGDDLFYWVPMAHKNWLVKPYESTLAPIVKKVYRGERIYDEAYLATSDTSATISNIKNHQTTYFKGRRI